MSSRKWQLTVQCVEPRDFFVPYLLFIGSVHKSLVPRTVHRDRFGRGPRRHESEAPSDCSKTTGAHQVVSTVTCRGRPEAGRSPEGRGTNNVGAPCARAWLHKLPRLFFAGLLAPTPRDHGFGLSAQQLGTGRGRWRRRFTCGRGYAGAQVSSSRCSAAKLGFELRFFNFSLRSFSVSLSLSPVLTRLGSIWWLVLGRTKGYLGDMRVSETCVPHKKEYLKL